MPKRSLSQLFVERIGPPKVGRAEYWDSHLPAFGLRVSASGVKSWQVMYRVGGKQVRETLGTVDRIPRVDEARALALASQKKARAGIDPVAERRAAAERAEAADKDTFAAVAERFLTDYVAVNCRPKTAREWKRVIEKDLAPHWGTLPIRDIAKANVLSVLNAKAKTRPMQADEVRKIARRLFGWAVEQDLIKEDPTEGVTKRVKKRAARERTLSEDEVRLFWQATDRLGWPFGPLFQLMLLTGQREGEVGGLRWSELDTEERVWRLPGGRTKNKRPHVVHLSEAAMEVLAAVPRQTGDLLFASRGPNPPSGYSNAKERLDALMGELPGWVLHDLRRTTATGLARLGIRQEVTEKLLNHVSGKVSGVAAVYNQHEYLDERRAASEAWGRYVAGLAAPGAGNVVQLAQRAG